MFFLQNIIQLVCKINSHKVYLIDHFKEVRRQIDIHRETLKAKIDEIALKIIDQINEREKEI